MNSRRQFLFGLATAAALYRPLMASAAPAITVTRDPNCGCCTAWADHLKENGFAVTVIENAQINRLKAKLGVPSALASCHTAEIDGYIIEGHVPASAIQKLLAQRPAIRGLAVPGMPVGSPGMEVAGATEEPYDVIAFGPGSPSVFARFQGKKELPAS